MKTECKVYVVTYHCVVFCVCTSFECARSVIRKSCFELMKREDEFSILEEPLILEV